MVKIFLTGATGYTGGEVLYALNRSSIGDLQIACLVRDKDKAQQVKGAYPDVQTVIGDLQDVDVVGKQAAEADIVLNFASAGSAAGAQAIAHGLKTRYKKLQVPGYWIQISGASVYAEEDIASGRFGYASNTVYDDIKDQKQIISIMQSNPKRALEGIVLSQMTSEVKTALIVSPLIYGVGKGPISQRSVQAPEYAKSTLELGHGFKLNDGENSWSNIHVQDLAKVAMLLISAAIEEKQGIWNHEGVYNVENGEMTFKDLGTAIAKEAQAQGLIKGNTEVKTIDTEQAGSLTQHPVHASILWGTNVRMNASRAQQQLGWSPSGASLVREIPEIVRRESIALRGT